MKSRSVTVNDTPTALARGGAATVPKSVAVQNNSQSTTLYVGGPDVSVANGFRVAAGGVFSVDLMGDDLYGIVDTGTLDVIVLERG